MDMMGGLGSGIGGMFQFFGDVQQSRTNKDIAADQIAASRYGIDIQNQQWQQGQKDGAYQKGGRGGERRVNPLPLAGLTPMEEGEAQRADHRRRRHGRDLRLQQRAARPSPPDAVPPVAGR